MKKILNLLFIVGIASFSFVSPFCFADDEDEQSQEDESDAELEKELAEDDEDSGPPDCDAPLGESASEQELSANGVDPEDIEARKEDAFEDAAQAAEDISEDLEEESSPEATEL